ncbi:MAG: hypothetical protein MHM6MM_004538 [Cercozoa sp. M6MM]
MPVLRDTRFDEKLVQELKDIADSLFCDEAQDFVVASGMSCDGYFEAQGRLTSCIVEHTPEDREAWLHKIHDDLNVRSMEMEGHVVAAICRHVGLPAAMLSVTQINRLEGDETSLVPVTDAERRQWMRNALAVAMTLVRRRAEYA